MAGAATGRHCEIQKHDRSSERFAKSKSPGEEGRTKACKSVGAEVCLDNRGRCYRRNDSSGARAALGYNNADAALVKTKIRIANQDAKHDQKSSTQGNQRRAEAVCADEIGDVRVKELPGFSFFA